MRFRFLRRKWAKINNPEFKRKEVLILFSIAFTFGALLGQCGNPDIAGPPSSVVLPPPPESPPNQLPGLEIIDSWKDVQPSG
ncbi:hypothetical protein K2X33_11890 [bacterium]|nr:hypothetical protein [bacterium]